MCCATSTSSVSLCCLFIFLLQFNQLNANPPSITSATSYVKSNVSVLGDKFSMGLYDLEFDQELYIPSGIGYCANVTCPPPRACPPCDYSIPKTCNGSGFGTPCVCPVVDCSQSASVPVLELDGPALTMTITPTSPYTFLFHAVVPNNSCSSILIKWSNTNGAITSLSAYRIADTLRVVPSILGYPSQVSLVRNSFLICPNGNLMGYSSLFSVIDLYSGVYPLDGYQVTFTAETFTLPLPHDPSCSVPTQYQGTHECLPSGVETMIPATGDVQRFVIKPDRQCGVMQFAASQFNLLISTNPWVSPQNSSGTFKTATYVQDADYIFSGEPGVFYYCLGAEEYLFVWVDLREPVRFFIDTSEEWLQNIPLSSISQIDFPRYTLGAVTVECPSKNFTAMKYTPSYIETFDSGSANLRVLYPSEESNPFSSFTFYDNYEWRVSNNPSLTGAFVPKKLSIALTLSQNLVKRLQPVFPIYFPHDYLYLATSEFYSCKVKLNGLIRNSNNEPIISTISNFQEKQQICNGKKFAIVKQQIQNLITESRNLTRDISTNYLDRLLYLRFTADVLSTSDAFYFCEEKVAGFVQLQSSVSMVEADYCLANFGSANFSSDPCCTSPDNKYQTCKSENRAYESYSVAAFSDSIETSCSAPVCARDAVQRYINEGERIKQSCSPPPQVAAWKKNRERFYWQCFTEIFGYDSTKPTPCRHDDDCPPVGGAPGICNSLHKNCVGNVTALEEQFLQCIMDNASPFVFSAISIAINVNKSDPDVFSQWWENLQTFALCAAEKHDVPAGYDSSIWGHSTVFPSCAYCSAVALEVAFSPGPGSTLWPWDCFGASLPCVTGEAPLPGIAYCFGSFTCNYDKDLNPFDPSGACSKRGQFCGFSENLRDSTDLTSFNIPPASCNSTILCILANGTQIITASQQECESIESCDICPGCNEQECSVAGKCTDSTDPIYSIWSGKIFGNATEGCLMQLSYKSPFITSSDICIYPLRSTVLGCMIFPPLVTPESCVDPNNLFGFSNVYIKKGNSTWITRSTNQQECEQAKACRNVPRPTTQKSFYSDITVCSVVEECQGDFGNLWKWETANWRGGQARFPELMEYGPYPTYQFGSTESLDFAKIFNLIQFAANQELSLEVGSSLFCEHNLKTNILDQLVCSCSDQEPESSCFTKLTNQSTETKLAVACGGRDSSFSSPPLSVDLQEDSIVQNLCYSVGISNLPLSAYAPPPSSLLTLLLIQSRFDYSYSIQNPNGQPYGKLLTDGFSLSVQSENQTLKNAGVCITRSRASDPRLPLYDIAILMDGRFIPQNQTVNLFDNLLCTNLTTVANGQSYFFIQKTRGDYLNPPRLDFTRGEIAYISVILALYVIGLIVVTMLLLRHIIINFILDRMLFVIIVMETFFLCRTILFCLALSNSQSIQQQPAVGYLLVEFPILLFFCFVSFFVITWGLILWSKKDLALSQKKFVSLLNICVILFNTIIFGLFILMIILFQTIVDPPYYICASTEVVFDSDRAYALSLSYRCIFSAVAIALGLALLFVGGWMLRMTSDEELGIPVRTILQVFIATVVGTFGLMAQAVYYLIVVAVGNPQSIYLTLSILLVDEVIPALIFTSLTITTNPNSKGLRGFVSKLTTKTKSSSSKSSSKSVSIPA